jgi:hypothetical protein
MPTVICICTKDGGDYTKKKASGEDLELSLGILSTSANQIDKNLQNFNEL